ncbi:MAG: ATP-binding cassette domain-containing protein [Oligoflexus sp.]
MHNSFKNHEALTHDYRLDLRRVKKRHQVHFQLDVESLSIKSHQFCVLLGPNGAGKTTLFQLLTGMLAADQGEIVVCGFPLPKQRSAALARIGVVFQESTLDVDLTVEQNLIFHASLHGLSVKHCRSVIHEESKRLMIFDVLDRKVRLLNGGHRRRVELVRALIHKPEFLLLDEPTAGLDLESRDIILQHVKELCAKKGMAALWCTHLLDEAHEAEQIYLLQQGKIAFQGSSQQLLEAGRAVDMKAAYKNLLLTTAAHP